METILLLLSIYIIPILIIWFIMYLLMKKGQTIEEFIKETDCLDSSFIIPMIIPVINIGMMIHSIVFYVFYKFKDWRK